MARDRALVYVRKSLVRTGSDTVSPERQRAACLGEAERHGWLVEGSDVYTDAEGHQSGKTDNRPGWQALRRRVARDGSIAAVIVESLSRSSRNVRSFLAFVDELKARDVALVSLKERFDTSSAIGHAMLGFIAIINQLESDLAAERMKGQIAYKQSRGRHWGYTPMGCQREAVTGALSPSAEGYQCNGVARTYHESLRRCYELYAGGRYGFLSLSHKLNEDGYRFRGRDGRPRLWTRDNARKCVVMSRVYEGWVKTGEGWVEANYQPILPVDLCRRVRQVWERRGREVSHPVPGNVADSDYILTGILYCGGCGTRLKGERSSHDGARQYRHSGGKAGCRMLPFGADYVEDQALALLGCLVIPPGVAALIAPEEGTDGRGALIERAARIEGQIERLVELALQTELPERVYERQVSRLNAELSEVRGMLEAEERRLEARPTVAVRLAELAERVREAKPSTQREILASVFERLEVEQLHPGSRAHREGGIVKVQPREWCRPFWCGLPGL